MNPGDIGIIVDTTGLRNCPEVGTLTKVIRTFSSFSGEENFVEVVILSGEFQGYKIEYFRWRVKLLNSLKDRFKEILLS